jgi:teichuronic acid exporter
MSNRKFVILSSFASNLFVKFFSQGITFIVQVFFARILFPSDFGIYALLIMIPNTLIFFFQQTFIPGIIQKVKITNKDYNSLFGFFLIFSIISFFLIILLAPLFESFFQIFSFSKYLIFISPSILISSIQSIQIAYIRKNFLFNYLIPASIFSSLISAFISIFLALSGFGIYSLILNYLLVNLLEVLFLLIFCKWIPIPSFDFTFVKSFSSFNFYMSLVSIIEILYVNIKTIFINSFFRLEKLGLYNKSNQITGALGVSIDSSLQSVIFSTFSLIQSRKDQLKKYLKITIQTISFIVFPIMFGFYSVSEEFTLIVLGNKWIDLIEFLRVFSITLALTSISNSNLQILKALSRTDIFFIIELIKKTLYFLSLLIAVFFGIIPFLYSHLIISILSILINVFPNKKLINYGFFEFVLDFLPALLSASTMIIFLNFIIHPDLLISLLLKILFGILIYSGFSLLLNKKLIYNIYVYIFLSKPFNE